MPCMHAFTRLCISSCLSVLVITDHFLNHRDLTWPGPSSEPFSRVHRYKYQLYKTSYPVPGSGADADGTKRDTRPHRKRYAENRTRGATANTDHVRQIHGSRGIFASRPVHGHRTLAREISGYPSRPAQIAAGCDRVPACSFMPLSAEFPMPLLESLMADHGFESVTRPR